MKSVFVVRGTKFINWYPRYYVGEWTNFNIVKLDIVKESPRYIYAEEKIENCFGDRVFDHLIDKEFLDEYSINYKMESRKGDMYHTRFGAYIIANDDVSEDELKKLFIKCVDFYAY